MDIPIIDPQKSRRKTPADYHAIAAEHGMTWLGPSVNNTHTKTWWLCAAGHKWFTRFDSVRSHCGCSKCVRVAVGKWNGDARRYRAEHYHELANRFGFEWVGILPQSNKTLTEWQCSKEHRWQTTFNNIQGGHGCPDCADYVNGVRVSKPQRLLCDLVEGALNYKIGVGRRTVDIALFVSQTKIAIEYDCYYWHANKQEVDRKRVDYLIGRGWKVLTVKASAMIPTKAQIESGISVLMNGQNYHEIVLSDWGTGNSFQWQLT